MTRKISLIALILITVMVFKINAQNGSKVSIKYSKNLEYVISKIKNNQKVSISRIEMTIPITIGEYAAYYDLSNPKYDENSLIAFEKLDSLIYRNAELNKLNFTKKVFKMAEFVDGEYADAYKEYIQIVIYRNKKYFSRYYNSYSNRIKLWLKEEYDNSLK